MQPEGSLPRLQMPATCPYREQDQFNQCPPSHFQKIHLNIILPSRPDLRYFTNSFSKKC